jgi:hypothetical protein
LPRKIETTTGGAQEFWTSAFQAGNFFRSWNALFGENAFSASNGPNLTRRICRVNKNHAALQHGRVWVMGAWHYRAAHIAGIVGEQFRPGQSLSAWMKHRV